MDAATVPRPRLVWDRLPFLVATAAIVGSELVAYLVFARTVPPSGDEQFYVVNARAIAAALHDVCHLDTTAARDLPKRLVDLGWFTPGMSFLLVPVAALTDSVPLFRLYVGLLNLGGTLAILWYLSRRSAAAPLIFAAGVLVVPYYSVFAFMLWGDLLAAHLLLLLLLVVLERIDDGDPRAASWRTAAGIGFAIGLITYVRGFYWAFCPVFILMIVLGTVGVPSLSTRIGRAAALATICTATLFATILPWTVAVSARYGFHLTTTSTTMSQISLLGSPSYVDAVGRPGNSFEWQRMIASRAAAGGNTFAAQAALERARATADTSLAEAARRIRANVHRFFFDSEQFLARFRRLAMPQTRRSLQPSLDRAYAWLQTVNHYGWRVLAACGLTIFFLPINSSRRHVSLSVVFKCVVLIFTMHPLMVKAHGRYYVEYVPFIAAALAGLASTPRPPIALAWPRDDVDEWLIFVVQAVATCIGGVLVLGYLSLA